jgi:hypothetical protein
MLSPGTAALHPGRFGPCGFLLWSVGGVGARGFGRGKGWLLCVHAMYCIVVVAAAAAAGLGSSRGLERMYCRRHGYRRYTACEAGALFESEDCMP